MSTFVLVHGAWHGAWCWYQVVPRLRAAGHEVITLDLPAHGTDTTPVGEVTLSDYVERVGGALAEADEQAYLLGHSMGGVVITQAAERYPERVDTLVYLSAFLLDDGEALIEYAEADEDSVVTRNLVVDEEAGYATVAEDAVREAFYADVSAADVTLATSLLRPEPLAALETPVETTDEGFGSAPRVYVGCTADRAITPGLQARMRETVPPDETHTLETGHSPFLAAPDELVAVLEAVAG